MSHDVTETDPDNDGNDQRLSYKFQRLRERLREAITSGELHGKLPGERQLARKFRVNAKTLSKALTDLAGEGLLERSIGRGTFVRSADAPVLASASDRWLIIRDEDQHDHPVISGILRSNPQAKVILSTTSMRPSYLNQFKVAIVFSQLMPDSMLRDLMVRSISVLLVEREPGTYSTHAVLIDKSLAATMLARELVMAGHTRFAVVEPKGKLEVTHAIRSTADRYDIDAAVDTVDASFAGEAVQQGATAIICASEPSAREARQDIERRGIGFPGRIALVAIGTADGDAVCSGYYVHPQQYAQTIVQLIQDRFTNRPTALWLSGAYVDAGTLKLAVLPGVMGSEQPRIIQPVVTQNLS